MAKNTHAQEVATGTSDSYTAEEVGDINPPQPVVITRPILGEVDRANITEAEAAQAQALAAKGKAIGEPAEEVRDSLLLDQEEVIPDEEDDEFDSDEEEPSAPEDGGDFTQSSQSAQPADSKPSPSRPQPARTTESRSAQTRVANSDVYLTDGDGHKTEPQRSGKGRTTPAKKAAPAKSTKARATMMGAEDGFDEDDFS